MESGPSNFTLETIEPDQPSALTPETVIPENDIIDIDPEVFTLETADIEKLWVCTPERVDPEDEAVAIEVDFGPSPAHKCLIQPKPLSRLLRSISRRHRQRNQAIHRRLIVDQLTTHLSRRSRHASILRTKTRKWSKQSLHYLFRPHPRRQATLEMAPWAPPLALETIPEVVEPEMLSVVNPDPTIPESDAVLPSIENMVPAPDIYFPDVSVRSVGTSSTVTPSDEEVDDPMEVTTKAGESSGTNLTVTTSYKKVITTEDYTTEETGESSRRGIEFDTADPSDMASLVEPPSYLSVHDRSKILDRQKIFTKLENTPEVMNALAGKLGLSPALRFYDVPSLLENDLEHIPRPVFALLFIIPMTEAKEFSNKSKDMAKPSYQKCGADEPVIWFKQIIEGSCASIGLLHCIFNGPAQQYILPNTILSELYEKSIPLMPEKRADLLYDSEDFEDAHESTVQLCESDELTGETYGLHFVAFVRGKDGWLWELQGLRDGPDRRQKLPEGEDILSEHVLRQAIGGLIDLDKGKTDNCLYSCIALTKDPEAESVTLPLNSLDPGSSDRKLTRLLDPKYCFQSWAPGIVEVGKDGFVEAKAGDEEDETGRSPCPKESPKEGRPHLRRRGG